MAVEQVVVIGASGNIGTSVIEALAADPDVGSVIAVARRLPQWSAPQDPVGERGRGPRRPRRGGPRG